MVGLCVLGLVIGIGALIYSLYKTKEVNPSDPVEKHSYRAAYHFTSPDHWKNDPQKPVYYEGKYHYYYLYNGDYPDGNGTEWRHATSKDLVHWEDEGIAIPKYTNDNGDPWTGSVVVDTENTAGFGKDAFVAITTQPSKDEQKQEQFLWYSTDKGKSFTSFSDEPIMKNPGTKDFRDPKIIWDNTHQKWIMTMAEGSKIGFYESDNLKDWRYTSSFSAENIGVLECPDLYQIRADDGTVKWALGVSANGKEVGKPNTYAYWIGTFNGTEFLPDNKEPQWLDYGFDWYGGVTFEDGEASDKLDKRYALAWMNNWDYADNTPTVEEGFNGMDSIVRQIELKREGENQYYLTSQPIEALKELTSSTDSFDTIEVEGSEILDVKGDAYQIEAELSWTELKNAGFRLRESDDLERHIDVGISAEDHYSYVNRAFTDQPDETNQFVESTAPFDANNKKVYLKILVDKTSIEVFVDDGRMAFSSLVFPHAEDTGITLFSEGGKATFKNVVITHFDSIQH